MRKTSTSHWTNLKDLDCLLFFAQSIDEMLYDFTLDSYKPLALNSRLLCIEVLNTIDEVKGEFMPKKNLQSILEELKWSLEKDYAAKQLFGKKFDYYLREIKPNEIRLNELETTIKHIYGFFEDRKYLDQIKKSIKELIIENKEKVKLKRLTNSFVTELINYGYNPNHIDFQNNNFFFNSQKNPKIDNVNILDDFFNIFDFQKKEFTVVFIGNIIFTKFKNTLNKFDVVVTKNYTCFSTIQEDKNFKRSKKDNESFIIHSKIKDLDHHSAKEQSENFLAQVVNIFNFFHHKNKPEILPKAVVSRKEDNYVVIINEPIKSILKTKHEERPDNAAKKVEYILENLKLKPESLYRFSRCIDLHSAALKTTAIENQILDLWASIETLIPKTNELNQDRIVQICNKLVPFLQINYSEKLFRQLFDDLKSWDNVKFDNVLRRAKANGTSNDFERLLALITLKDNSDLRKEIYNQLDDYPLLKFRIYELYKSFNTPKSIKKTLNNHQQKLEWHLRRIYRTRSLIIHSGSFPSYTNILIEHLHNYFDIFLSSLIDYASDNKFVSIEEVILEMKITFDYHQELLEKHISEDITEENYKEVLLGIE